MNEKPANDARPYLRGALAFVAVPGITTTAAFYRGGGVFMAAICGIAVALGCAAILSWARWWR